MNTRIEEIDGKFFATLEGEMDTAAAVVAEVNQLAQSVYYQIVIN
jgi:hypothetical protein